MQVFLPWPSYEWSHRHTDSPRLNKGLTEAFQLGNTSMGLKRGHINHPARTQFHDRVGSLLRYVEEGYKVYLQRPGYVPFHLAAVKFAAAYQIWCHLLNTEPIELSEETNMFDATRVLGLDILSEFEGEHYLEEISLDEIAYIIQEDLGIPDSWQPPHEDVHRVGEDYPLSFNHPAFHLSQQFNLARKRADIYAPLFNFRAQTTMTSLLTKTPALLTYGDRDAPYIDTDIEPYLWPLTDEEGKLLFQIGTKTDRSRYAHVYDEDPTLRTPLIVSPERALERLERDHPTILTQYLYRVSEWKKDSSAEYSLEKENEEIFNRRHFLLPE